MFLLSFEMSLIGLISKAFGKDKVNLEVGEEFSFRYPMHFYVGGIGVGALLRGGAVFGPKLDGKHLDTSSSGSYEYICINGYKGTFRVVRCWDGPDLNWAITVRREDVPSHYKREIPKLK